MKKIIYYLILTWKRFMNLFKRKEKAVEVSELKEETKQTTQQIFKNRRIVPPHNNRKNTLGRFTQYIDMGGYTRPIYHGSGSPRK